MYKQKKLDFGFVILSPEHNIGSISGTVRSIKNHYSDVPIVCAVGKDTTQLEFRELKKICPDVWRGENTITSLINTGMKRGHKEWNVLIMEGVWIKHSIIYRYTSFLQNKKDILFPIVSDYDRDGKPKTIYKDFENCTLNGVLIHQETFKEIGPMPCCDELNHSKFIWGAMAKEKGCKFKGVLGIKLC